MAEGQPHEPLNERRTQPVPRSSRLSWPGGGSSEDTGPPVDRGPVMPPLDAIEFSDGRTAAPGDGDWLFPYGFAVGVGSRTCDSGGRQPSDARRPGVPVSDARGVGSSITAEGNIRSPEDPR